VFYYFIRICVFIFSFIIVILSIGAPILQTIYGYPDGESIYILLHKICHQYPTRSFWIMNRPFALCSRCFGGYLGLSLASLLITFNNKFFYRIIIGIIFLLPGIIDGLVQLKYSYESTNLIRFITGMIGGIGFFLILCPNKKNKEVI